MRQLRVATKLSQAEFAARIGVSADTFRMWDAGRRTPPAEILAKARVLAEAGSHDRLIGLPSLSRLLGVSVYRLREAARDGRLVVSYINRAVYGRPVPRATLAAGEAYKRQYHWKRSRWTPRPPPPNLLANVPPDYDKELRHLRSRLQLSQAQLAAAIGAAGKAVVYQWESRRRTPTGFFWRKIQVLSHSTTPKHS
jgi:DNA-binding transcriptional regulator YiaG